MEVVVQIRESYPVSGQWGLYGAATEIKVSTNAHYIMCLSQSLRVYFNRISNLAKSWSASQLLI